MNNIGIVGCGKLGICYAILFAKAGYNVYINDINLNILDNIKNDTYKYTEDKLNELIKSYKSNLILAYNLTEILDNCDIIFTYIQTPSLENGLYNHEYINNFIEKCIIYNNKKRKTIIISSTVIPEYCESIMNKLKINNYNLCYNPSFIAQGSIIKNIINPDFILIGNDENNYDELIEIYNKIVINPNKDLYKKMKLLEAEITKLSINCYITSKITFANMIGDFCINKKCDQNIVLNAICSDTRIGNKCFNYGYGYGGPCLPRDNSALYQYTKNNNFNFNICKLNDENNNLHLMYQYNNLKDSNEPIIFKYITYKDNSDIIEESHKLKLALLLTNNKNKVIIYERPFIIDILKNTYKDRFEYRDII
jgi:UDPglucose 6-dehydrogenase